MRSFSRRLCQDICQGEPWAVKKLLLGVLVDYSVFVPLPFRAFAIDRETSTPKAFNIIAQGKKYASLASVFAALGSTSANQTAR